MDRLLTKVAHYFRRERPDDGEVDVEDEKRDVGSGDDNTTVLFPATRGAPDDGISECRADRASGGIGVGVGVGVGLDSDSNGKQHRFCEVFEKILLWENTVNSISFVVAFNILFWGIIVLEVRGFAAASSAALVVVLCYSTLEAQTPREDTSSREASISQVKIEQIEKIGGKMKCTLDSLKRLRKEQPGVFCTAVCTVSVGLWIIGRTINGVMLAYTICMSILIGPAILLKVPGKFVLSKEWDSEIEEFLPAVTEDNLQVLKRACETGDHSPSPTSLSDSQNDPFNEEELLGLKMPSHEDGSTDGVELSELELSTDEVDVADGMKFQSGHFEKGSSSEEEAELEPESRKLPSHSDDSDDSDFEIIDSQEVENFEDA